MDKVGESAKYSRHLTSFMQHVIPANQTQSVKMLLSMTEKEQQIAAIKEIGGPEPFILAVDEEKGRLFLGWEGYSYQIPSETTEKGGILEEGSADEDLGGMEGEIDASTKCRVGEKYSYRSPFTNCYYPTIQAYELEYPSPQTRQLEFEFNNLLLQYVKLYYNTALSSVYIKNLHSSTYYAKNVQHTREFLVIVMIHKDNKEEGDSKHTIWESFHKILVTLELREKTTYKVNYFIRSYLTLKCESEFEFSASVKGEQNELYTIEKETNSAHIKNIGRLLENLEGRLRSDMETIYLRKIHHIVRHIREKEKVVVDIREEKLKGEAELNKIKFLDEVKNLINTNQSIKEEIETKVEENPFSEMV